MSACNCETCVRKDTIYCSHKKGTFNFCDNWVGECPVCGAYIMPDETYCIDCTQYREYISEFEDEED